MSEEKILCIPSEIVAKCGARQGFTPLDPIIWGAILNEAEFRFIPRAAAEHDHNFKQIIPYIILKCGDKVFNFHRNGNEGRLLGKRSIGVGGHVNSVDAGEDLSQAYQTGMARELYEEVVINTDWSQRPYGIVNYDSDDVGKVHVGVVHIIDLAEPLVGAKEEMLNPGFSTIKELYLCQEEFERWSQFCLRQLVGDEYGR